MVEVIDLTDDTMVDATISSDEGDTPNGSDGSANNDTARSFDGDELTELKYRFSDCLLNQKIWGETAYFEVLPDPVNPAICIDGLGTIGLPLSPFDQNRIVKSTDAKLGKDAGACGSTQIAALREIPSSKFKLRNPSWTKFMESLVKQTAIHMGYGDETNDIDVRLVKLLIQSPPVPKPKSVAALSM